MDTSSQTIRVLIADDHPIFRDGLRRLFDAEPDFDVVGEATDGAQALELTPRLDPDVLLLDLAMPGLSGLDVLRALGESLKKVRALLLVAGIEKPEILNALRLGARGVVLKASATTMLFKALRAVMANEYWVGRDTVADLVENFVHGEAPESSGLAPRSFRLTPREFDVLELVVDAHSNRDVAQRLLLSEETVKHHIRNIFDKTGVSNRLELTLFAMHHRLVRPS